MFPEPGRCLDDLINDGYFRWTRVDVKQFVIMVYGLKLQSAVAPRFLDDTGDEQTGAKSVTGSMLLPTRRDVPLLCRLE
jgi:hypothetical protein